MKYRWITLGALLIPALAPAQEEADIFWRSFGQLTAERFDGPDDDIADDDIEFGADRVRLRLEATRGALTGGLMFDFGTDDLGEREPGAFPNIIGDLFVNYRPNDRHLLRFGQFKTPLGMDFNTAGRSLDITKRGMEAGLVLNRDVGVMLSGRGFSGLGYDIGLFNPAGRSAATAHTSEQEGAANAPVARLLYDMGRWHAELSHGSSEEAGGPGTSDYEVNDIGLTFREGPWTVKAEWIEGNDVRGVANRDERVYYFHGGYRLTDKLELVARRYDGESTLAGSTTSLSNTYIGVTRELIGDEQFDLRLQVNYLDVGGNAAAYTGVRAFREDGILVQLQLTAQK